MRFFNNLTLRNKRLSYRLIYHLFCHIICITFHKLRCILLRQNILPLSCYISYLGYNILVFTKDFLPCFINRNFNIFILIFCTFGQFFPFCQFNIFVLISVINRNRCSTIHLRICFIHHVFILLKSKLKKHYKQILLTSI